jgi:hypothetical protein
MFRPGWNGRGDECAEAHQSRDQTGINHGSCACVERANRAGRSRHKECVARNRDRPSVGDKKVLIPAPVVEL